MSRDSNTLESCLRHNLSWHRLSQVRFINDGWYHHPGKNRFIIIDYLKTLKTDVKNWVPQLGAELRTRGLLGWLQHLEQTVLDHTCTKWEPIKEWMIPMIIRADVDNRQWNMVHRWWTWLYSVLYLTCPSQKTQPLWGVEHMGSAPQSLIITIIPSCYPLA